MPLLRVVDSPSLSPPLFFSLSLSRAHGSLTTRRESIRDQPLRSTRTTSEAATWNSTARDRKPIVSAALAGPIIRKAASGMSATPIPENRNLRLLPLRPPARHCPALHVRNRAIKIPRKRIPACPRSLSTRRTFYGTSTVARPGLISRFMPVALDRVETRCPVALWKMGR